MPAIYSAIYIRLSQCHSLSLEHLKTLRDWWQGSSRTHQPGSRCRWSTPCGRLYLDLAVETGEHLKPLDSWMQLWYPETSVRSMMIFGYSWYFIRFCMVKRVFVILLFPRICCVVLLFREESGASRRLPCHRTSDQLMWCGKDAVLLGFYLFLSLRLEAMTR